ncbi:MAG: hypothetical protein FWH03_06850 [Firmicutes bacterium]|nr:hypothetical protein [Bacillota bacterium]
MQANIISLGRPITAPSLIPICHTVTPQCINTPIMVNGACRFITAVSLGAPFGAVFVENVDAADIAQTGKALAVHPLFPQGASIVFIQLLSKQSLKARFFEGAGKTASALQAAAVAAITAMMLQKTWESELDVLLDEKTFRIKWDRCGGEVFCVQ